MKYFKISEYDAIASVWWFVGLAITIAFGIFVCSNLASQDLLEEYNEGTIDFVSQQIDMVGVISALVLVGLIILFAAKLAFDHMFECYIKNDIAKLADELAEIKTLLLNKEE